ncbi:hypothetical protein [Nocardioides sp. GY 10127]|uniref:hypothetical protein n=1 Tax=Nocardioides sp. GY 10127 TaxID=2569762 RepID=UPI00145875D5|nr:hypothetical protein [Nocardioides sp. GY 10127]
MTSADSTPSPRSHTAPQHRHDPAGSPRTHGGLRWTYRTVTVLAVAGTIVLGPFRVDGNTDDSSSTTDSPVLVSTR